MLSTLPRPYPAPAQTFGTEMYSLFVDDLERKPRVPSRRLVIKPIALPRGVLGARGEEGGVRLELAGRARGTRRREVDRVRELRALRAVEPRPRLHQNRRQHLHLGLESELQRDPRVRPRALVRARVEVERVAPIYRCASSRLARDQ